MKEKTTCRAGGFFPNQKDVEGHLSQTTIGLQHVGHSSKLLKPDCREIRRRAFDLREYRNTWTTPEYADLSFQ
jgi:hypothetical protein